MQQRIDLHLHSNQSDGSLSPKDVIKKAGEAGLAAVSLTDHDTVSGLLEAREEARRLDLSFLNGVELNVSDESREVHVLGYGFDAENPALLPRLALLWENRARRSEKMALALRESGIPLELVEVRKLAPAGVITRVHFAMALKNSGIVPSVSEAFERYLNPGKPGYVPWEKLTMGEAAALIEQAGGIAVLAHPFQYTQDYETLKQLLQRAKSAGIRGMECYYARYDKGQTKTLLHLAKRYGLIATGGSDFHGAFKPGLQIGSGYGNLNIPFSVYETLLDALGHQSF